MRASAVMRCRRPEGAAPWQRRLDLGDGGALVGRQALGGRRDELVVAADEDVDLVADVGVRAVLAGGGQRGRERER